jgi:hypothetical protein
MYFLWNKTSCGPLKISYEGLLDFVNYVLHAGFRLYGITLKPSHESRADLTVIISDEDIAPEIKEKVEKHLSLVLDPTGMEASVVWASPERGIWQFIQNPYVWALIASCSAVIVTAGFAGFFWTAFWGSSAWFTVRAVAMLAKKIRSA